MNEKEVSEIRRRFKADKSSITHIRGCYVNTKGEIVSEFNQSVALMPEDESEKFFSILKKTLSGTISKNLVDIEFSTQQVLESDEHKLLMALRDSRLKDDELIHSFFERMIQSISFDDSYLILLTHDAYDVPYRSKDGERQDDASSEVYSYVLCSICPIKETKPALSYDVVENRFRNCLMDWIVSPPEMGFLFPAFVDRTANIYSALYYTRNIAETNTGFVDAIFGCEVPMPAAVQKETFQGVLCSSLEQECSFETVQSVHETLQGMIEEHKANKVETPLTVSKESVARILKAHGVSEERVEAFEEQFEQEFGADASLSPKNIVDTKQTVLTAPDVKIQVNAGRDDLVETRILNGIKYILIRAEEGVEVNGVPVHIS